MIEEQAIVVSVQDQHATLEVIRSKPCGICGQTRGCGVSLWGRIFSHQASIFKATNQINAKIGDAVIVGIDEQSVMLSALAVYGIPLVALFAGGLLASMLAPVIDPGVLHSDRNSVIGSAIGLLLGFLWLKGHQQGGRLSANYQPVILRIENESIVNVKFERG